MTETEQKAADDQMRALIADLIAETARLNAETARSRLWHIWLPLPIFAGVYTATLTALMRLLG